MNPKIRVAIEVMMIATSSWVLVRLPNRSENTAVRPMPMTGTPEPSIHTTIVRPMMPGARRCGGGPAASASAATGRMANSVKR